MEQADYVHLVRISELASADNSKAYRRGVVWFAALGYLWVVGCLVIAAGLLVWAASHLIAGQWRFIWVMLALGALGLFWTSLKALWVKDEPAQGILLDMQDVPELFDALERIRRKIRGPRIDAVYLNEEFNASIRQVRRWGVLGGSRNELSLGLPLMMALDRNRLLAVLAHEYGHLRGGHGKFGAWIYRTRLSWSRLHQGLQDDAGPASMATRRFLDWYFPRFLAKTFAMARQDEYEADGVAAGLVGKAAMADALVELEVKHQWLQQQFWSLHWRSAFKHAIPRGPYKAMNYWLTQPVRPAFAQSALRTALQARSGLEDTHPVLRDRVQALTRGTAQLPQQWSEIGSTALLGAQYQSAIEVFERQWRAEHATTWKQHHARLRRSQELLAQLQALTHRSAAQWLQSAQLMQRLDQHANVRVIYEEVLRHEPDNAVAMVGLIRALPEPMAEIKLQLLEHLCALRADYRFWGASQAVEILEDALKHTAGEQEMQQLKLWRERARQAQEQEAAVSEELEQTPLLQGLRPHQLNAFELSEMQVELSNFRALAQAWLVAKPLNCLPQRRTFVLFADMGGLGEEEGLALGQEIHDRLELPGVLYVIRVAATDMLDDVRRLAGEPAYWRGLL